MSARAPRVVLSANKKRGNPLPLFWDGAGAIELPTYALVRWGLDAAGLSRRAPLRYVHVCVSRKWGVARWDAIAYGELPHAPLLPGVGLPSARTSTGQWSPPTPPAIHLGQSNPACGKSLSFATWRGPHGLVAAGWGPTHLGRVLRGLGHGICERPRRLTAIRL